MADLSARINLLATRVGNYIRDSILPRLVPAGGTNGQFLKKTADTDFSLGWGSVSASAGGSSGQVQYNSSNSLAGTANVAIDNNDLILSNNDSPVVPSASKTKVFGRTIASRMMLGMVGPKGDSYVPQPSLFSQNVAWWCPPGNTTTTPGVIGFAAPTALGVATVRTVAITNLMSRTRRLGYVSSTTAGSFAGHYSTAAQYTVGNGAGLGGFFYNCRFAFSDAASVSGVRAFIGLSSSVATATNVEPSTLTNAIGLAQLSTNTTQLYIVYGGSVAQTAIGLGTNFPPMLTTGATGGVVYNLTLFSVSSESGIIYYRVERVGTSFFVEGTLTPSVVGTQTPAATTLLAHRAWRCNNTTALAAGLDITSVYIEMDQ